MTSTRTILRLLWSPRALLFSVAILVSALWLASFSWLIYGARGWGTYSIHGGALQVTWWPQDHIRSVAQWPTATLAPSDPVWTFSVRDDTQPRRMVLPLWWVLTPLNAAAAVVAALALRRNPPRPLTVVAATCCAAIVAANLATVAQSHRCFRGDGYWIFVGMGAVTLRRPTAASDLTNAIDLANWQAGSYSYHLLRPLIRGLEPSYHWLPVVSKSGMAIPLWILLLIPLPPLALAARRALRQRAGCCGHCGYSLSGLTNPTCPECGTSLPSALSVPSAVNPS